MRILWLFFLSLYDSGGCLFLAGLDFPDFVCIENDRLEREIEQPAENVAAYKDDQPYKIVLIETCGDNQRDKKGNQADGNADESQNDVFVLYRWFHIVFFGYYL